MDINELAQKQIYELKPLEMVNAKELGIGQGFSILKVPGGWIFVFIDSSCFVAEPNGPKTNAPKSSKKSARKIKSTRPKKEN
jgi:hypothetical protein